MSGKTILKVAGVTCQVAGLIIGAIVSKNEKQEALAELLKKSVEKVEEKN